MNRFISPLGIFRRHWSDRNINIIIYNISITDFSPFPPCYSVVHCVHTLTGIPTSCLTIYFISIPFKTGVAVISWRLQLRRRPADDICQFWNWNVYYSHPSNNPKPTIFRTKLRLKIECFLVFCSQIRSDVTNHFEVSIEVFVRMVLGKSLVYRFFSIVSVCRL